MKHILTGVVVSSIVLANVLATKIAQFGDFVVPAGFLGLAVAFLATDLLSENYGKEAARNAVVAAAFSIVIGYGLIYTAMLMPSAPFYDPTAYNQALGASTYIVVASFITIIASQYIDITLFHLIKERVEYKWARNIGSTATSQLVDTTLFIGLAFFLLPSLFGGNVTPLGVVAGLIVGQYLVKLVVALLDTPLFYLLSRTQA